jgi:surface protein
MSMMFGLTKVQATTLFDFFETTLVNGTKSFTYAHPRTGTTYSVKFTEPPQLVAKSFDWYDASVKLVVDCSVDVTDKFISSWKTDNAGTSSSVQITLPLESSGVYDFWVNWGDDSVNHITLWNQTEKTHTYSVAGTYAVTIWGTIQGWRFNNGGDKLKILSITNWGPLRLGNSGSYFYGCANLTIPTTDTLDMTGTTTMYYAFTACAALAAFPSLVTLDTSEVTNMFAMFADNPVFNESAVNNLDTSKVTNMSWMFSGCYAFNQSVSNFNTANATKMSGMFAYCYVFNQSLVSFDTSNVDAMNWMFYTCTAFNQSVSNFNTSKVTDMTYMFRYCDVFNQSVANFNTSKVTNMQGMFNMCPAFNQDVSTFDVKLVTTMVNMFNGANALSQANYEALLVAWEAQVPKTNVVFHGGDAVYAAAPSAAATAKASLVAATPGGYGWTITDGGAV